MLEAIVDTGRDLALRPVFEPLQQGPDLGELCRSLVVLRIEQLDRIRAAVESGRPDFDLMALDSRVTDCNGAFFDVANEFRGCIAGCHEVLRRQGLLEGIWCLDPAEGLSPGQAEEIDRVYAAYPDLNDDAFVAANLERWLS